MRGFLKLSALLVGGFLLLTQSTGVALAKDRHSHGDQVRKTQVAEFYWNHNQWKHRHAQAPKWRHHKAHKKQWRKHWAHQKPWWAHKYGKSGHRGHYAFGSGDHRPNPVYRGHDGRRHKDGRHWQQWYRYD